MCKRQGAGPAVILTGDFPDPTVVRNGDTYYMTHSSFNRVPGLLIWCSKDLYNWQPLTHALRRHVGNVWAPDLVKHGDLFYLYFPAGGTAGPATSHMVVSARSKSPLGPWENSPRNPIVRTWSRLEPWWSKGHGTVLEGPDDQWYIVYHGYENGYRTMGRQTLIEPIDWTDDGWYDISSSDGQAFEAQSVRNYRLQSDDFEGPELSPQWTFDGIDSTDQYSISNGAVSFEAAGDRLRVFHALASDHNYEADVTIDIDGSPEVGFVLYYGQEAFAGVGLLDGQVVLIKGGRPFLRSAAPCADCRYFKIRMFEHDVAVCFSADGSNWTKHPRGLEVSGFQTNNLGGFSSLKLGVYAKGSGSVRVQDFRYRAIE